MIRLLAEHPQLSYVPSIRGCWSPASVAEISATSSADPGYPNAAPGLDDAAVTVTGIDDSVLQGSPVRRVLEWPRIDLEEQGQFRLTPAALMAVRLLRTRFASEPAGMTIRERSGRCPRCDRHAGGGDQAVNSADPKLLLSR
jgi:hypothetical protein